MLTAALLTLREGLEAALIVSILLSYLDQIGNYKLRWWIWSGVGIAGILSLALAVGLQVIGTEFEGAAEQVFEGLVMLLAVAVLSWMIFWMRYQARYIKQGLEADMQLAVRRNHHWGLFGIAFLAVFREGVETSLFLTAASFTSDGLSTLAGSAVGLAAAIIIGWLIHTGMANLSVRAFFNVTSIVLLIFAAGLFAHGIHELQEAGWIPIFAEHVWDTKPILDDGSPAGSVLRTLVGYNDNPSLLEVIGYVSYWIVVLVVVRWGVEWYSKLARSPLASPNSVKG
jgi:high-affinity iron transporter